MTVTPIMRSLADAIKQSWADATERRNWAREHLPGAEKSELFEDAHRFESAALAAALKLADEISACPPQAKVSE